MSSRTMLTFSAVPLGKTCLQRGHFGEDDMANAVAKQFWQPECPHANVTGLTMVERLLPLKETTKIVRFSHQNHIANSVLLVLFKMGEGEGCLEPVLSVKFEQAVFFLWGFPGEWRQARDIISRAFHSRVCLTLKNSWLTQTYFLSLHLPAFVRLEKGKQKKISSAG